MNCTDYELDKGLCSTSGQFQYVPVSASVSRPSEYVRSAL